MTYYSTTQAATFLGVSRQYVWKLVRNGDLEAVRIGRFWCIPLGALRRFANDR